MLDDIRRDSRSPVQLQGKIIVQSNLPEILCTVIDLSQEGAGLWLGTTFGIPNTFKLLIADERAPRLCKVAWKKDHRLGISFV
jgi:hypothetical protein